MAATGADASHRSLRASLARQVVSVHRIRRVGVVNRSHVHRMDADGSPCLGLVWLQHVTTRWSTRLGRNSEVYVTTISVLSPQLDLDARATLLCVSVFSPSKSIKIWIQSLHSSWCMLHLLSISVDAPSVSMHPLCFPWLQKDCLLTIQSPSSSTRITTLRLLTIRFILLRLLSLYLHSCHHHLCFFHPRVHPFQF